MDMAAIFVFLLGMAMVTLMAFVPEQPSAATQLVPTFDLPSQSQNYLRESSREASEIIYAK